MRYADRTYLEIATHASNGWLALIPMDATDSFTTSIALHRHPELVRPDRVPGPSHGPVDWDDPGLDFTAYSSSGVIGDPRHGSAERGAALWSECVAWTVGLIRQVAAANSDPPRK